VVVLAAVVVVPAAVVVVPAAVVAVVVPLLLPRRVCRNQRLESSTRTLRLANPMCKFL
jgi:uncharacterized paraquat-inducible protein A